MRATEKQTTEFRITAVCTVTDPVERQRRLAQAYGVVMDICRQKRVVTEIESDDLVKAVS